MWCDFIDPVQYHVLPAIGRENKGLCCGTVVGSTVRGRNLFRYRQWFVRERFAEPGRPRGNPVSKRLYTLLLRRNLLKEQDVPFLAVIIGSHLPSLQVLEEYLHRLVGPLVPHTLPR